MIHVLRPVALILAILVALMVAVSEQNPVAPPSAPASKQAAPAIRFKPAPVSNAAVPRPGDIGFEVKKFPIDLAIDPAVQSDLGVTAEQAQRLQALNSEYAAEKDNQSEDERTATAKLAEWNDECKAKLSDLLSADQWERLGQIAFQTIGKRFVTDPEITAKLMFLRGAAEEVQIHPLKARQRRPSLSPFPRIRPIPGERPDRRLDTGTAAASRRNERQNICRNLATHGSPHPQ